MSRLGAHVRSAPLALLFGSSLWFLGGASGCGKETSKAMPFAGTYDVMVEAGGKSDPVRMYASVGANDTLLLNFSFGISQLRTKVTGPVNITIVPEVVHVEHSTGIMDGIASGTGVINTQQVADITLNVLPDSSADGGSGDGGSGGTTMSYRITGSRI